jgi:hypothetical protein
MGRTRDNHHGLHNIYILILLPIIPRLYNELGDMFEIEHSSGSVSLRMYDKYFCNSAPSMATQCYCWRRGIRRPVTFQIGSTDLESFHYVNSATHRSNHSPKLYIYLIYISLLYLNHLVSRTSAHLSTAGTVPANSSTSLTYISFTFKNRVIFHSIAYTTFLLLLP